MIDTGLTAFNTLGSSLQPIKRHEGQPLRVYTCGPTVYADAHLGHARTYVSLDMIRRIMTDYFRIPVVWCMNITDIDDKIINEFNTKKTGFNTVFEYSKNRENAFFKDMDALNVRRPDSLLRVTEMIPEIIKFIEDLVKNGFAYEAKGSVYFDVMKYANDQRFTYAELEPESFSLTESRQSEDLAELGKHNDPDFALWKGAKPGEPSWDSPWGKGRPGWHIECSAMSDKFFGNQFDIHCGGIDLRFPHHTNEIAQTQARSGCVPWVHTWLHTGQLKSNGEKMSKSLHNYKTISTTLQTNDFRLLRMAFALTSWQNVLDFNEEHITQASNILKRFTNFLEKAEGMLQTGQATEVHDYTETDRKFTILLEETQLKIRNAFANNFNIPAAINALQELINASFADPQPNNGLFIAAARLVNQILNILGFTKETVKLSESGGVNMGPVATTMAEFRRVTRPTTLDLLKDEREVAQALGVNLKQPRPEGDEEAQKRYDLVKRLDDHVKKLLADMDKLRDDGLPSLGIRLEDRADGSVDFKIGDPEDPEIKQKKQTIAKEQKQTKQQKKEQQPKKAAEPIEHPSETFRKQTDQYSQWDESGIPTHDAEGKPLPKSRINKLKGVYNKLLAKYNKQHKNDQ